jgi:hypothetical protein
MLYYGTVLFQKALAQAAADDQKNQRLGLLQGLLRVRCWKWAKVLFAQLESMGVNACLHLPVAKALCGLIHTTIDPWYVEMSPQILDINPVDTQDPLQEFGTFIGHVDVLENVEKWEQFGPTVWSLLTYLRFQVRFCFCLAYYYLFCEPS